MLDWPLAREDGNRVEYALRDGDALVRMAALRAAGGLTPDQQLQMAAPMLEDPVRSVRLEAVSVLAALRQPLPAAANGPFLAAAEEYRAAQLAIASRPEAHVALAEFEGGHGDFDKALAHYQQAFAIDPNHAAFRHSFGLLLARFGRYDQALPELREAARLDPEVSRYTYVYGVALNSLGNSGEAIRVLEDAQRYFPADFDVAWALATILRDQGDIDRAREIAVRLAEQHPGHQNVAALLDSLAAD